MCQLALPIKKTIIIMCKIASSRVHTFVADSFTLLVDLLCFGQ